MTGPRPSAIGRLGERSLGALAAGERRGRVALVLGSGGVKCTAAVGLWKVLARESIPIDVAVGCSGGSIYAAAYALGEDVAAAEARTLTMWSDLFTRRASGALLRVLFPRLLGYSDRVGLIDDRRLHEVLWELFGGRGFAETRIPLHIAATDYATGEKVVLRTGDIADAVRASVSLPLLLPPWRVGGRLLVDGGASDPLPVDVGIREGCDIILAMGFESPVGDAIASFAGAVRRTSAIVTNHLLRSTFAFYSAAHHAEIIPMIPSFDRDVALTDTSRIPHIIDEGERIAEEQLPYLRKVLAAAHA